MFNTLHFVIHLWAYITLPMAIVYCISTKTHWHRTRSERDAAYEVLAAHLNEQSSKWVRTIRNATYGDYFVSHKGIEVSFDFHSSGRLHWCKLNDQCISRTWGKRFHLAYTHGGANLGLRTMVDKLRLT